MLFLSYKKKCSKCGIEKDISEFYERKTGSGTYKTQCKFCEKQASFEYRLKNLDRIKKYQEIYRKNNRNKLLIIHRKYAQKHKKERSLYRKKYYIENTSKIKEYYQRNKSRINLYLKSKRQNDATFRMRENISKQIQYSLINGKGGESCLKYLPFTIHELKSHIESLWTEGMSWDNYGRWKKDGKWIFGWEIDHIIPQNLFAYSSMDSEEFKKCWALSNLRPLWHIDNISRPKYGQDLS